MTKKKVEAGAALIPLLPGSLSKTEITGKVEAWLNDILVDDEPASVYIQLKQLELALKTALERLNEKAFDDVGHKLHGEPSGTILGHKVELSYPAKWEYSPDIFNLEERLKTEIDVAKKREQLDGVAKKVPGKGVLRVTLRQ